MADIREQLDEIQERIENPWKGVNVRGLLMALRVALDAHWETCACDEERPCRDVQRITAALDGA